MHKSNRYIAFIALSLLILTGCQKYLPEPSYENNAIKIITKAGGGSDAENAVRTLRLFIFSGDGNKLILNKLYLTSEASQVAPAPGSYTYFIKNTDGYIISEMISKEDIRIIMVANEMSPLDMKDATYDYVKGLTLDYYGTYNSAGAMNIVIEGTNSASNTGYIPMVAETGIYTPNQWNAGNGNSIDLNLKRTLAKVDVRVKSLGNVAGLEPGDKLTIQSASIIRVPTYCYLGDTMLSYSDKLVSNVTKPFLTPIQIDGSVTPLQTDILTFYVPEYNITSLYLNEGQYMCIQINAEYYSDDTKETIKSVYRIPLGNGTDKLYDPINPANIADLTVEDLTVSRNMSYNVEATVGTIGKLEVLQVALTIKDWEGTVDVDGDAESPRLNIATLQAKMSDTRVRVYFWTNKPDVAVMPEGQKNGVPFTVNDVFTNLSGAAGINTSNFKLFANGETHYYPYSGYMDLEFNNPADYKGATETYTIALNAGGLKRNIDIIANPIVGQIVFNPNGGTALPGAQMVFDVKYSDLNTPGIIGNDILIANPIDYITPPTGKIFRFWSYSLDQEQDVINSDQPVCTVTLNGYRTEVYAFWR